MNSAPQHSDRLLQIDGLKKHFGMQGQNAGAIRAIDGVNLELNEGETVGIVGESGCGKSTLGRAIVGVHPPTSGSIKFRIADNLVDVTDPSSSIQAEIRRSISMVFQDPGSSLNPRKNIRFSVGEPLMLTEKLNGAALTDRVAELLEAVGLPAGYMERFPHAFSGGQRQRVALARALAVNPKLIIADEAVSALDVSVQAQIVNLFLELQRDRGIAFLFISHDLKIVRHVSDRVVVMYLGKIVEEGNPTEICDAPQHPYTEALLSAVPGVDRAEGASRIILKGDPPTPINPPSGCRFRTRCAHATSICAAEEPELRHVGGSSGRVACHHAETLSLKGIRKSERLA